MALKPKFKLLSAGGVNGQGHTEVVASLAGSHFQGGRIKCRVKLLGNLDHGVCKSINPGAHDFDGETAWVLIERLFGSVDMGRIGGGAHKRLTVVI